MAMPSAAPIALYPNPTCGEVAFSQRVSDVLVFDLAGEQVMQHAQPCSFINLEELSTGWYAVQFNYGGQRWTQQIIRE